MRCARPVQPIQLLHTLRAHAMIGPNSFIAIEHPSKHSPTPSPSAICHALDFTTCRPGPRGHNDRLTSATSARHAKSKSRPRYSRAIVESFVLSSRPGPIIVTIMHQQVGKQVYQSHAPSHPSLLRSQRHVLPPLSLLPHPQPSTRHVPPSPRGEL